MKTPKSAINALLTVSLVLFAVLSWAQVKYFYHVEFEGNRFSVDSTSVVKNAQGEVLPFKKWTEMMSTGEYKLRPLSVSNGKPSEILIRTHTDQERIDTNKKMQALASSMPNAIKKNETFDDFALKDISGKSWILSELKGKVIVLNFWFTGCAPCIKEIPELNELVKKFQPEKIVFLSLAMGDDAEKIRKFLEKREFSYHHIPHLDAQNVIKRYGIMGFPTHVVMNGKRKVTYVAMGYSPTTVTALSDEIQRLIK